MTALQGRTFAFAPPILNVEHNEWQYRKASWSEVLVANSASGLEVWIPRRLVGEVSDSEKQIMTVGLLKELEYKAGSVWPHEQSSIKLPPTASNTIVAPIPATPPAHPRYAEGAESRIGRLVLIVFGTVVAACLLVFGVIRLGSMRPVKFTSVDQDFLSLSRHDDYFAIVRKLGPPAEDRWSSPTGALQYRALWYPKRGYYVVMVGTDRNDAHYIGAVDSNWRVVHYVELPNGGNTASQLRAVPRF